MATSRFAVSYKERNNGAFDQQIDKITHAELNSLLNEKIDTAYVHKDDESKHVTQEERNRWDNMLTRLKTATKVESGLLSPADKTKLDGIAENANNYEHPRSGATAGTYMRVTVNDQGHVIYGDNPTRIDATCTNAEYLGNQPFNYFARANNPVFTGTMKIPDATIGSPPNTPVTVKLLESYVAEQLNRAWPIGSIFITVSNQNPEALIGGKWKRIGEGRCLVGVSDARGITLRKEGGSTSVTLSNANIPSHDHTINISGSTSGVGDHTHNTSDNSSYTNGTNYNDRGNYVKYKGSGDTDSRRNDIYYVNETINRTTTGAGGHSHTVNVSGNTSRVGNASPASFNIENPYLGVFMWERIS
jgi:ethanolamine utilisation protein eutA